MHPVRVVHEVYKRCGMILNAMVLLQSAWGFHRHTNARTHAQVSVVSHNVGWLKGQELQSIGSTLCKKRSSIKERLGVEPHMHDWS